MNYRRELFSLILAKLGEYADCFVLPTESNEAKAVSMLMGIFPEFHKIDDCPPVPHLIHNIMLNEVTQEVYERALEILRFFEIIPPPLVPVCQAKEYNYSYILLHLARAPNITDQRLGVIAGLLQIPWGSFASHIMIQRITCAIYLERENQELMDEIAYILEIKK